MIDYEALYLDLDDLRDAHGLSWKQLGEKIEVPWNSFLLLAAGHVPDGYQLQNILSWLGESEDHYFLQ